MEVLRVVIVGILAPWAVSMSVEDVTGPTAGDIPAVYNLGDSNSDTGGLAASLFPPPYPYGETFFGAPAGRACDGRLVIDFIAEQLRLPYVSAYLDSVGSSFRHGANFATGGATIRRQNESWFERNISPFPLDVQVDQFSHFKQQAIHLYTHGREACQRSRVPRPEDFSKALYTMDIGQNDLSIALRGMTDEQLGAAIPDIINQFATAVRRLYEMGARILWIHNTGPNGCLPTATLNIHDPEAGEVDEYGCVKGWNEWAMEFNRQLKDRVTQLRTELSEAALTYVDLYAAKYGLISNANNLGFVEPLKICCGIYGNSISIWCGQKGNVNGSEVFGGSCEDPSKYISWDGVHYSEAANHWIANQILLNASLSDPPIQIVQQPSLC